MQRKEKRGGDAKGREGRNMLDSKGSEITRIATKHLGVVLPTCNHCLFDSLALVSCGGEVDTLATDISGTRSSYYKCNPYRPQWVSKWMVSPPHE